jgi:hypothetical protein
MREEELIGILKQKGFNASLNMDYDQGDSLLQAVAKFYRSKNSEYYNVKE